MEPVFPFALTFPEGKKGSLRRHLHAQLRAAILDGRLAPGARLPATRKVASSLGVGRNTVISAYDLLIAEGYVIPRAGAKAVVADFPSRSPRPAAAKGAMWRRASRAAAPASLSIERRLNPMWRTKPFLGPVAPPGLPERSFRVGVPDHRFFPHETWRRLFAQSLRAWSKVPFRYTPTEGIPQLREAIAQHVAFTRAVACSGDDIVVTSGAQQAFDLVARLLVVAGRTRVAVEEPGYPPLRAAFSAAGAQIAPIAVDEEGIAVHRLPTDVRVVSVTPSHQSPTGVALSLRRRAALLEFARARDAVIIEDDYDGEFRFGTRPLDALQTLDRDGRVFYVGTFSKSLFPALRIGFVVAPRWARDALVRVKQGADSHCDETAQATLAAFIRDGHLARHVRRMRPIYAARRETLLSGLEHHLAAWLAPIPSEAGLHLAARILQPEHALTVVEKARECLPGVQSISEYSQTPLEQLGLSFGYGVIDAGDIKPALMRLRRLLEKQPATLRA